MTARRLGTFASLLALFVAGCANQPDNGAKQAAAPAPPPPKVDSGLNPINPAAIKPSNGGKAILFITNANSPFWDAVETGMKKGSEETGVEARMERNAEGTIEGQIRLVEEALTKKDQLSGVCISALQPDAEGLLAKLRELKAAGIHVITMDSDCKADAREAFIGTNNLAAGEELGKKVATMIPSGAKFCAFVGDTAAQNAKDRLEGFMKGAGDKFVKLEVYQDGVDPTRAKSNVETALHSHQDATMMLGLWSYNGPAIGQTVQAAGKLDKIKVVCFDAEPNLLPLLADGTVSVSCVQHPFEFGRQGMKLLNALAKGDKSTVDDMLKGKDVIDTGVDIVDKDSYPAFKKALDEKGLKSS